MEANLMMLKKANWNGQKLLTTGISLRKKKAEDLMKKRATQAGLCMGAKKEQPSENQV